MNSGIPTPKGILFDMDGVLVMPTQSSHQSWHHVSLQFASSLDLPVVALEEALYKSRKQYYQTIEHDPQKQQRDRLEPFETRRETVEHALEQLGKADKERATEMVHAYEALREKRQLTPFALETLQKLRQYPLPLALISNGNATYQRRKIEQHHLAQFFDTILIEQEFGAAKPDHRIFLTALDRLGISAQSAWMIGDNLAFDIAPAQQLGLFTIWCTSTHQELPESSIHPDHIIDTLAELLPLLREAKVDI